MGTLAKMITFFHQCVLDGMTFSFHRVFQTQQSFSENSIMFLQRKYDRMLRVGFQTRTKGHQVISPSCLRPLLWRSTLPDRDWCALACLRFTVHLEIVLQNSFTPNRFSLKSSMKKNQLKSKASGLWNMNKTLKLFCSSCFCVFHSFLFSFLLLASRLKKKIFSFLSTQ